MTKCEKNERKNEDLTNILELNKHTGKFIQINKKGKNEAYFQVPFFSLKGKCSVIENYHFIEGKSIFFLVGLWRLF